MTKKKVEETKETALATLTPEGETVLALRESSEVFAKEYGKDLEKYAHQMPTLSDFERLVSAIAENEETEGAEEMAFACAEIMQQTSGERDGMFSKDDRTEFPELRIFHGSGNDPNRPAKQAVGTLYLNTCEDVGETFVGTVIAIWQGRTMWGSKEAGESTAAPICSSMNRVVGGMFGRCVDCPDKPWRGGQQTRCSDDVVAFMLSKELNRLVLVRFAKTSEPAGRRLFKLLKLCSNMWSKWFEISLETKSNDKNQWYTLKVQPAGKGDDVYTPPIIHPFCQALMSNLSGSYILPGLARNYTQAADAMSGSETSGGTAEPVTAAGMKAAEGDDEGNYGSMPAADDDAKPNV